MRASRYVLAALFVALLAAAALGVQADQSLPFQRVIDPAERAARVFERTHPLVDTAIQVGERLTFSVRFGPIRAGEATMEIPGIVDINGDSCYHVVTTAQSNGFFSTFFYVNDRVESYITTDFLQPRRFEKHLLEGSFKADVVVHFDPRNNLALYDDGSIIETLPGSHDILSAFYSSRAHQLEPGMIFNLECHADRKNYPLRTEVYRRERVRVPAGEFDCLVIEPMLRTPGLFKQEGSLTIWLTDDKRRIPVQMKSKLPVGSISVVLVQIERGSDQGGS